MNGVHPRKRRLRPDEVQLGDLPPIIAGEEGSHRFSQTFIAGRWLFGLATTTGTATLLMAGALFATVDRIDVATPALARMPPDLEPSGAAAPKGDLAAAVETALEGVHQSTLSVPVVRRDSNRQTVTTRPYRFVSSPLPALRSALSADIPEYNLAKTISSSSGAANVSDAIYSGAASDFFVEVRSFPLDEAESFTFAEDDASMLMSAEEGLSAVHLESVDAGRSSTSQDVAVDEVWPENLPDTPVRPPNVTLLDANLTALQKSADGAATEKNVFIDLVQPGDTLEEILLGSGIEAEEAEAVGLLLDRKGGPKRVAEGDIVELHFTVSIEGDDVGRRLERFTAYRGGSPLVSVGRTDAEGFAIAKPHRQTPPDIARPALAPGDKGRPSLYEAVYQTASDAGIPDGLIGELVRAFAFEIDLTGPARVSDRIDVVFNQDTDGATGEVLYASLTVENLEYRVYRFRDLNDDETRLYDDRGRSASRRLLRKPVSRSEFRSGFGMRNHPILKRRRMHTGVDWAAPRGTPIYAAGNATVISAGWQSGYGRAVRLNIGNRFQSFYAHMSKIAPGLKRGDTVRQGDIIGYVGTSGLSTGNHLHYELSINGRRVDPLRVRIPHQRELTGSASRDFQQERDRIDSLVKAAHGDAHYAQT